MLCPGSGGWTQNDAEAARAGLPLVQLYDMQTDAGEQQNVYAEHPQQVKDMIAILKHFVDQGRSTPGARQTNDVAVDIWKLSTMPGLDHRALDDY